MKDIIINIPEVLEKINKMVWSSPKLVKLVIPQYQFVCEPGQQYPEGHPCLIFHQS